MQGRVRTASPGLISVMQTTQSVFPWLLWKELTGSWASSASVAVGVCFLHLEVVLKVVTTLGRGISLKWTLPCFSHID